jgi:two-component system NarL family response regulator
MVQGQSNREIAATLFLGESTVKSHVAAVMQKLDASDRIKAVTTALRRGLVQLD